jgi:hypothetical protein
MADTYKIQLVLEVEVEKSPFTTSEAETIEFVEQSMIAVTAQFAEQNNDPKYLGPKMRLLPIDYKSIKVVEN